MLPKPARLALLSLHIAANAVWLGGVCAVLALQLGKDGVDAGVERATFLLHDVVVIGALYVVIATGLTFSLFTSWASFASGG